MAAASADPQIVGGAKNEDPHLRSCQTEGQERYVDEYELIRLATKTGTLWCKGLVAFSEDVAGIDGVATRRSTRDAKNVQNEAQGR